MAHLEEIPLFPLHTVLFPGASLQLHIFEPRYVEMIKNCVSFDQPFGVVLIRHGNEVGEHAEPYMVGTAARIVKVLEFENGKLDITVEGEHRFRVRQLDESQPHLVGLVEPVVEMEADFDTSAGRDLLARAKETFEEYLAVRLGGDDFKIEVRPNDHPYLFSFFMCSFLQIQNLEKQRLLETTDTLQRLTDIVPMMRQFMDEISKPRLEKLTVEHLQEWVSEN